MSQTPEGKGISVVREVVAMVQDIFPDLDDKGIMIRIACAESNFGNHPTTYRKGYHGGIWQVDPSGFAATQDLVSHPKLKTKYKMIQEATDISWESVVWEDLRKPLYSGIAARLILLNKTELIPSHLEGQAGYWKEHYNTESGKGTVDDFISRCKSAGV